MQSSLSVPSLAAARKGALDRFISYGFYPLLLGGTAALYFAAPAHGWNLATVFAWMAGVRMVVLLLVEFLHPAKPEWKMTRASFWRDLKYMAVNGGVTGLLKLALGVLAIDMSRWNTGIITNSSVLVEFIALCLVFEFFQYWYHRLSHEGSGHWGAWLWKVHLPHHLPDKVYLLMHPVGHPLNLVISLALVQLPLVLLGARPEAIFLFNAVMGLQGLLSHYNVDIKAGPLNYIVVGTELHRYHHSADVAEAKNYGVMTPFWDIVFGTFEYHPERLPKALGVQDPEQYPPSTAIGRVLALPFKR